MHKEYKHKVKLADLPDLESGEKLADKIICPNCNAGVSAKDTNIQEMVGKCTSCDSIFSLKPIAASLNAEVDTLFTENLGRPAGVELNYFNDEMEISLKQNQVFSTLLVILAPLFLFLGVLIFYKKGFDWAAGMAAVSAVLTALGTWNLVNGRKHRTYVTLSKTRLDIEHRPKNLTKDRSFSTASIEQFFVSADLQLGGFAIYALVNSPEGQKRQKIVGGLKSQIKGKYLEQEMERYLGIKNKKVIGEIQ